MATSAKLQQTKDLLFGLGGIGAKNIKLFPGSNRETLVEDFASQIAGAINEIASGNAKEMDITECEI